MASSAVEYATTERSVEPVAVSAHSREELPDVVLSLSAIGGAVVGAFAGTAAGAGLGSASPVAWGTLGTMLGSLAAAVVLHLAVALWHAATGGRG